MRIRSVGIGFIFVFIVFLSSSALAQEKAEEKPKEEPKYGWQKAMVGGINLTQTSFSNWTQGGESSFAWQLNLNFIFVNDQKQTSWAHSGKLTYGAARIGEQESRKSIDEIKLESVFTYKFGMHVNPFFAATGETQFAPGYDYGVEPRTQMSAFMDPGYFRESVGIGFEPNKIIKTRFGVGLKQTITNNFPVPFTDDPETEDKVEKFKNEAGFESVTDVNWKLTKNSLLTSKLELFYGFGALDETDVKWDNVLSVKVSKYIGINFNFILFYDKDISSRRQIKQSIAFGLTYNFL
jgi:hypothetical protein